MTRLTFGSTAILSLILMSAGTQAATFDWQSLPEPSLTEQGAKFKLRREFTALGFEPEVTRQGILEYIRERRGGTEPLALDDDNSEQLVLVDANGKKWKAEIDGGVTEIQDAFGRYPKVFESKAQWFKQEGLHRMHLVLDALIGVGAKPSYAYGGGHIHIELVPYFQSHPVAFASLINLALTYEPILVHLMTHQRRLENARPLTLTRMSDAQKEAAGITSSDSITLGAYLGSGLNRLLAEDAPDCREDKRFAEYMDDWDAGLPLRERCILSFLAHFGTDVVGARETAINLQSWRGAKSKRKLHDSLEFRFFNAPHTHLEAALEERLIRLMANRATLANETPISYRETANPVYDLDSYYLSYFPELRRKHFTEFLREIGVGEDVLPIYLDEYLDAAKHGARRWDPETGL